MKDVEIIVRASVKNRILLVRVLLELHFNQGPNLSGLREECVES